MIRSLLFSLMLVTGLLPSAASIAQILPTPQSISALQRVDDPQISRDGAWILYTVSTPQPRGQPPLSRLWRVPAQGHSAAQALPAPAGANEQAPRWRDNRRIAFLSNRPNSHAAKQAAMASTQLWSADADGSAPQLLTRSVTDVSHYAFSPDGQQVAYLAIDALSVQAKQAVEAKNDAVHVGHTTQFSRLWVRDLQSGETRALTPASLQVQDMAWSPVGDTLAIRVSDDTTLDGYWYRSRIVLLSLPDGALSDPLETLASAFPLQFSPDGSKLLYGHIAPHGMVGTQYVQTLATGKRVTVAQDWPGTLWVSHWQDDKTLIAQGLRGVRGEFLHVDASTGTWRTLAKPKTAYPRFSVAPNGHIAFIGLRDDQPPEVWTLAHGKFDTQTDTNPQVASWAHGVVRELDWKSSRDGRQMTGVLVTPPDWKPGKPLPTLVELHGGPAEAWWSGWMGSWHDWAQLLSTHGYAVFLPNPRGSEGQGHAFTELIRQDWGGADFQDILDGVDLLQAKGVIDPARLGVGGWSYGGYMSAWAVTQSKRFKTAIVGAGVIDLGAMALTTDVPTYLPGYFGDPIINRAQYDARSPLHHVHNIHVPVLILHGQEDKRVPLSQGQMLYRALKFNGTPVEMVTYPRGAHWFTEQEHERDVQQRVIDWLDLYLR